MPQLTQVDGELGQETQFVSLHVTLFATHIPLFTVYPVIHTIHISAVEHDTQLASIHTITAPVQTPLESRVYPELQLIHPVASHDKQFAHILVQLIQVPVPVVETLNPVIQVTQKFGSD